MKSRIIIAGAGGFGRGVYDWLVESLHARGVRETVEVAFIDDDSPLVQPQARVVSTIEDYRPATQDEVICAVASPKVRQQIVENLQQKGAVFHSFVDHRAVIGSRVQIGEGAVVCPGAVIDADAELGSHVHVNANCFVGHDTKLNSYVTLSPAVNVMGQVSVGTGSFLGGSTVVLPRTSVGEWSILGAGAVLVQSNPPRTVMVGNPARAIQQHTA